MRVAKVRRRAKGQGSIRLRADGLHEARVSLGRSADGKRRSRSFYGSRKDAETWLKDAVDRLGRGSAPADTQITVAQFLRQWLRKKRRSVGPRTYEGYRQLIDDHLVPELGDITLTKLRSETVGAALKRLADSGLAPRTVLHVRAVLRSALNSAITGEYVTRNVAATVDRDDLPKVKNAKVKPMEPAEARSIIAAVRGESVEVVVIAALYTGLRQGELLGLRWADIDFAGGKLSVGRTLQRIRLGADGPDSGWTSLFALSPPKSETSDRDVFLPAPLISILLAHRGRQDAERSRLGPAWASETAIQNRQGKKIRGEFPRERIIDFVFTDAIGGPLNGTTITHQFAECQRRAGLKRYRRFHDLRHGAASLWLAAGVDLKTVSTLLGHSAISVTADVYLHVISELKADAASKLGDLISGTTAI